MKEYLREHRPDFAVLMVIVFLLFTILTLMFPLLGKVVLLEPSNLYDPLSWYKLLTYPLYGTGLVTWINHSIILVLIGFIIEKKVKRLDLIGLVIMSTIVGGFLYIVFNQDGPNVGIASPVMISWGYLGVGIVIGLKDWQYLNLFEKILVILFCLSVPSIYNDNLGFLLGQLTVLTACIIFTALRYPKATQSGVNKK